MRLTTTERRAIKRSAATVFGDAATVRLFGSRVDDTAHGGDIDLHIELSKPADGSIRAEARFRALLEDVIGERKVDIVFAGRGRPGKPIDRIARRTGIVL